MKLSKKTFSLKFDHPTIKGAWLLATVFRKYFLLCRISEFVSVNLLSIHFRILLWGNCENWLLSSKVICGVPQGARVVVTTHRISACRWDRNEIPTVTLMFLGFSNSVKVVWVVCNQMQDGGFIVGFPTSAFVCAKFRLVPLTCWAPKTWA
jgi:hypothetical protein